MFSSLPLAVLCFVDGLAVGGTRHGWRPINSEVSAVGHDDRPYRKVREGLWHLKSKQRAWLGPATVTDCDVMLTGHVDALNHNASLAQIDFREIFRGLNVFSQERRRGFETWQ
jgi:hypothetical protein